MAGVLHLASGVRQGSRRAAPAHRRTRLPHPRRAGGAAGGGDQGGGGGGGGAPRSRRAARSGGGGGRAGVVGGAGGDRGRGGARAHAPRTDGGARLLPERLGAAGPRARARPVCRRVCRGPPLRYAHAAAAHRRQGVARLGVRVRVKVSPTPNPNPKPNPNPNPTPIPPRCGWVPRVSSSWAVRRAPWETQAWVGCPPCARGLGSSSVSSRSGATAPVARRSYGGATPISSWRRGRPPRPTGSMQVRVRVRVKVRVRGRVKVRVRVRVKPQVTLTLTRALNLHQGRRRRSSVTPRPPRPAAVPGRGQRTGRAGSRRAHGRVPRWAHGAGGRRPRRSRCGRRGGVRRSRSPARRPCCGVPSLRGAACEGP